MQKLWNYFDRSRLKRRVAARKKERARSPFRYTDSPNVSLVLLSFNHRRNIAPIIARLRNTVAQEVIVCEDGSVDGSEREWGKHLTRPNDFLIRSNDIHEIRSYNRAIDHARGEIVCVMQDDDIPPARGEWVADALALFDRYPKLGVLGCWVGWTIPLPETIPSHVFGYDDNEQLRAAWGISLIPYLEPELNIPFMFVQVVGLGPMLFRKSIYCSIGGFDLSFSAPGESGIALEHDICYRAWCSGYQVGLFHAPGFVRGVGGHGTLMFGADIRKRNKSRNMEIVKQRYSAGIDELNQRISALNHNLVPAPGVSGLTGNRDTDNPNSPRL
jgi:GT2 family glycosyltransferase